MVKKLISKLNIKMQMVKREKLKHGALSKIIYLFNYIKNIQKNGQPLQPSWAIETKTNVFIDIEDSHNWV